MKEEWTGNLVGRMHNADVKASDLAEKLGWTTSYVSMVLNCKRSPVGAREKLEAAFDSVVAEKTQ